MMGRNEKGEIWGRGYGAYLVWDIDIRGEGEE
jgi:hypothetical protein